MEEIGGIKMKTFEERYKDEVLTDNTQIETCSQCLSCKNWGNGDDPYSNKHDKSCCDKYPFPQIKPSWVINNYGECDYYEEV